MGEVPCAAGGVEVRGTVAYVPQQAAIFNASFCEGAARDWVSASFGPGTDGASAADEERTNRRLAALVRPASGAAARIIWCMAGTAVYQVGRY